MVAHAHLAVGKGDIRIRCIEMIAQEIGNPRAQRVAGRLDRHAVEVGTRACRRGRGIGHLAGIGCGDLDGLKRQAKGLRGHLRDLGEQALAHLGAAMIQMDRAIRIDMHQRARLVKKGQRERNAEFHRRQGDALFHDRVLRVPVGNRLAAGVIVGFLDQGRDQLVNDRILDLLMIGRGLWPLPIVQLVERGIEIPLPHDQRIKAQFVGDMVNHALDPQHALWAAKAAIGGV